MFGLHELLESTLANELARENLEHLSLDELSAMDTEMMPSIVDHTADLLLESIKKDAPSKLKGHQRDRKGFEKTLGKLWKSPLDLLDLFICLASDASNEFHLKFQEEAVESRDAVFEALMSLNARACQVSGEVLALLCAGFADGAHARWRSLHEMAVVATLIQEHGQDLAERYLLHETIQKYWLACEYQRHFGSLGDEPLSDAEFEELDKERNALICRFGKPFDKPYGWAASVEGSKSPTLRKLAELAQLDHMMPYYGMASGNVHPNSYGTHFRLGLHSFEQDTVLLAGPSNYGLAESGHVTAIALLQTTTSLLNSKPLLDCYVTVRVLEKVAEEVGEAFLKVDEEMEALAPEDE